MKKPGFILLFWLCSLLSLAQQRQVDSLKAIIARPANDTALVNALIAYDNLIYLSDPELDEQLNKQVLAFTLKKLESETDKKLISFYRSAQLVSVNNLGIINMYQSKNDTAIAYFNKAIKLANEINNKQKIAAALNNFGVLYYRQGNIPRSVEYYTRALSINESIGEMAAVAAAQNNIASIYMETGDTNRALLMFRKSIESGRKVKARTWEAISLSAIAEIISERGQTDSAEILFNQALKIDREVGNKQGVGSSLANLGKVYLKTGRTAKAREQLDSALVIFREVHDQRAEGLTLNLLSEYYESTNDISTAISFSRKSLDLQRAIGQLAEAEKAANSLSKLYRLKGDYRNALEMRDLYGRLHDSLVNDKTTREVMRQEFQYEYDKQAALDSIKHEQENTIQEAMIAKKDAQLNAKRNIQIALVIGLLMLIVFSVFIYNRFKLTRKQNEIIEKQRQMVEAKNQEVMDSINYAKHLQDAILPPHKMIREILPLSFIFYRPKDVVAGDFYWMQNPDEKILFAAGDCTGHGVPGAMVSVICNNALNRSVREYGITEPGKILDKTREIVIQEFEKSENEVHDGMDISLFCLQGNKLSWAGANNPLWIIRKNKLSEFECLELKADKQPIGKHANAQPFQTHVQTVSAGETLYLFSDGYQDQFGGEKGKKFKSSNLKKLLLSIQEKSMDEQKILVEAAFDNWKMNHEQVDDVCVVGIRI